jgi:tRNA U38,U39,U40 pseudouridine synthase TruA
MARLTSPNFIIEKMKLHGFRFYRIFDNDGKTVIDEQNNPEVDLETACNRLESTLHHLDGLVKVRISDKSTTDKAAGGASQNLNFDLQLGSDRASGTQNNQQAMNFQQGIGAIAQSLEEKFNAKLEALQREYEHKQELKMLQEKIETLQSALAEKDPLQEFGMQALQQYGPAILGSMFNTPAGIAGHPPTAQPVTIEDIDTRAEKAILRLLAVDPGFIDHLEKLATMAETNRVMYDMAVSLLNQPQQ